MVGSRTFSLALRSFEFSPLQRRGYFGEFLVRPAHGSRTDSRACPSIGGQRSTTLHSGIRNLENRQKYNSSLSI